MKLCTQCLEALRAKAYAINPEQMLGHMIDGLLIHTTWWTDCANYAQDGHRRAATYVLENLPESALDKTPPEGL